MKLVNLGVTKTLTAGAPFAEMLRLWNLLKALSPFASRPSPPSVLVRSDTSPTDGIASTNDPEIRTNSTRTRTRTSTPGIWTRCSAIVPFSFSLNTNTRASRINQNLPPQIHTSVQSPATGVDAYREDTDHETLSPETDHSQWKGHLAYGPQEADEWKKAGDRMIQDLASTTVTIDEHRLREEYTQELLSEERKTSANLKKSLDDTRVALVSSERARSDVQADASRQIEGLKQELERVRQELANSRATVGDVQHHHEQPISTPVERSPTEELSQSLLNAEVATLRKSLGDAQRMLTTTETTYAQSRAQTARETESLSLENQRLKEENAKLTVSRGEVENLTQENKRLAQELLNTKAAIAENQRRHRRD